MRTWFSYRYSSADETDDSSSPNGINTPKKFPDSTSPTTMKTSKTIAKLFILLVVVTLGSTLHIAQAESPSLTKQQAYQYQLEDWIDKIQYQESRGNPMMVILDTNNKYSYGCMQYQMDTWIGDSRKYGVKGEMMDCKAQRKLAMLTIQNEPKNGWRRWYNSTKKVGLPPVLDIESGS